MNNKVYAWTAPVIKFVFFIAYSNIIATLLRASQDFFFFFNEVLVLEESHNIINHLRKKG